MFTICSRHRPSRRSPGRRSDGPGQGPVKPESAGFGPIPGKTRGFLADTTYGILASPGDGTTGSKHERSSPDIRADHTSFG